MTAIGCEYNSISHDDNEKNKILIIIIVVVVVVVVVVAVALNHAFLHPVRIVR
jgi:flagellar basal body-associated protein FliL